MIAAKPIYKTHGYLPAITGDQADFLRRRVSGFLQNAENRTLLILLQEAYLAGLKDAQEVLRP